MGGVRWAFPCASWRPRREEWLLAARLVQPEEKERIGRLVFARDAKAALAGRLLMRKLIAEKLCIPWNEIHLERTSKGKPFLANAILSACSNYNFNVSHQGDYAVLAAEPELQVGVDVMKTSLPEDNPKKWWSACGAVTVVKMLHNCAGADVHAIATVGPDTRAVLGIFLQKLACESSHTGADRPQTILEQCRAQIPDYAQGQCFYRGFFGQNKAK